MILIFSSVSEVFAASCCAGGSGSSQIITAQNKSEFRFSLSHSQVVAEKFQSQRPLFWDTDRQQLTTTLAPSVGFKVSENWQLGLRAEILTKRYQFEQEGSQSQTLLGDSFFLLAWEALPMSPSYSWLPQVFLSLETTLPTGRGLYESQNPYLVDVSGVGRWEQKLGATFLKIRPGYRLNASFVFANSFKESQKNIVQNKRSSYFIEMGVSSHHPRKTVSLGVNIRRVFKNSFLLTRENSQQLIPKELYYDFSPFISWIFTKKDLLTLTYTDQTLLGPVYNTNLSRSLSLNLTRFITL